MTPADLETLIHRHLDGLTSAAEAAELSAACESSESTRRLYLRLARLHASLAVDEGLAEDETAPARRTAVPFRLGLSAWLGAAACAAAGLLAVLVWIPAGPAGLPAFAPAAAHVLALQDCRWVHADTQLAKGEVIRVGQRLELSSGQTTLRFVSGAEATLIGPCIFEVTSGNSGFLTLGQVKARAEGAAAKGFTLTTRTARVVDIGTEFVAAAAPDGQSRVDVTAGEVSVHLDGVNEPQRLRQGDALAIEAGRPQVLVRIESGDGTKAFRFPTIAPPSDHDWADHAAGHASIRLVRGTLHRSGPIPSGPVELLLDGRGQAQADSPAESVFIDDDADGALLLDLGRTISIARINTYSWHQQAGREPQNRVRAVQKYTLYGHAGETTPPLTGNNEEAGWVRIARVDSDSFLQVSRPVDRPAQQASSISGARGPVGRFRFLLWELEPSRRPDQRGLNNTFYAEFDVYGAPPEGPGPAVEKN